MNGQHINLTDIFLLDFDLVFSVSGCNVKMLNWDNKGKEILLKLVY